MFQCCSTASHRSLLHAPTPIFSCSSTPKIASHINIKFQTARVSAAAAAASSGLPARDRVIDFGRHKGKMLGTLPSTYLKWLSNNLRARDFEHWANLADDVLDDAIYRDRIEWEFAEKVLNGDVVSSSTSPRSEGTVSELLQISERFGWDNENKAGWSKIDFGLLGTSKGGRIPRLSGKGKVGRELGLELERSDKFEDFDGEGTRGGGERRKGRRERLRMKRGGSRLGSMEKNENGGVEDDDDDQVMFGGNGDHRTVEKRSPFPGRESLLKKVLSSRKR